MFPSVVEIVEDNLVVSEVLGLEVVESWVLGDAGDFGEVVEGDGWFLRNEVCVVVPFVIVIHFIKIVVLHGVRIARLGKCVKKKPPSVLSLRAASIKLDDFYICYINSLLLIYGVYTARLGKMARKDVNVIQYLWQGAMYFCFAVKQFRNKRFLILISIAFRQYKF